MENWPSYKGVVKPKISEYVGEQTLSVFPDDMTPNYTFDIIFTVYKDGKMYINELRALTNPKVTLGITRNEAEELHTLAMN